MKKAVNKVYKFLALLVFLAVAGICVLIGLGPVIFPQSSANV